MSHATSSLVGDSPFRWSPGRAQCGRESERTELRTLLASPACEQGLALAGHEWGMDLGVP